MISSNSVSSFYPKRAGKPPKKAPAVPKPAGLSKLPRAIVALLASSVGADSTSPVTGTSTTALTDGGYVVTWSRLDGSISSRAFSPDGSGGFVAGTVTEVVEKSTEPLSFPGALISGQISATALPDQIPAEQLTGTLPAPVLPAEALYHNPIGSIVQYPTETVPENYLECNGQLVLRDAYPELFSTIGVTYGPGDSVTTFALPDYRGQFLRGWNHGAGVDTDCDARTDRGDGTTGDAVGTRQDDEFRSHSHTFKQSPSHPTNFWPVDNRHIPMGPTNGNHINKAGIIYDTGGSETRPKNIAVMYIIRAK